MPKPVLSKFATDTLDADSRPVCSGNSTDALLETLITQIATGDEHAFRCLYDATVSKVHHLAHRITRRMELAEETVPEVYLQAWREAGRFDPSRARVLTWLLVICRSRALDCLRRCDRAQSVADSAAFAEPESPDCYPEQLMLLVQRDTALRSALARLAPMHRQLVALAFLRGLSHLEIAAWLDMPLGSIKTHLRKALQLLKADLATHQNISSFHEA